VRIAQLVVSPVRQVRLVEIAALEESARGAGGFGSTGVSTDKGDGGAA
jgi:dUTP pyrophosphatase